MEDRLKTKKKKKQERKGGGRVAGKKRCKEWSSVISACGRERREDCQFKASLGYISVYTPLDRTELHSPRCLKGVGKSGKCSLFY